MDEDEASQVAEVKVTFMSISLPSPPSMQSQGISPNRYAQLSMCA